MGGLGFVGMDEETERRLAAMIMEEAAILRRRADKEGVHVYLAKPTVRVRPNPQFLQATIRSIEQSNRIAEVNEMWRRRSVELDVDHKGRRRRHDSSNVNYRKRSSSNSSEPRNRKSLRDEDEPRSRNRTNDYHDDAEDHSEDFHSDPTCSVGLRDEEVDRFLHSRVKRGRGSVGSRMDETGPYPVATDMPQTLRTREDWEDRLVGPRLPEKIEEVWKRRKLLEEQRENERADTSERKKAKSKKEHKKKKKKKKKKKGKEDSSHRSSKKEDR